MLKQTDILKAARAQLKALYPDYPVYLDDAVEDIASPAFMLKLVDVIQHEGGRRIKHDATLHITWFAQKKAVTSMAMYEIKDAISNSFIFGFQAGDRYLKPTTVSVMTSGEDADIIQVDLPFIWFDNVPDSSKPLPEIHNINTTYHIKGD